MSRRRVVVTGIGMLSPIGNDVGMGTGPSPAEARFGVIGRPTAEITIGTRVGFGLNDQIGAPQFRATIELTYAR